MNISRPDDLTEDEYREALGLRPFGLDYPEPDFYELYCSEDATEAVLARLHKIDAVIWHHMYIGHGLRQIVYYK